MTKYNTGNPIGSTAVKDLYDNAENLDVLVNDKTKETHPDRLGQQRKTWHGMEQDFNADQTERASEFDADQSYREGAFNTSQTDRQNRFNNFIASSGYQFLGDYAAGIEITEYNQIVRDPDGGFWRLSGQVELPYTTTGAGLPEDDAMSPLGDAVLRQQLSDEAQGAAMIGRGVVAVDSIADLLALPADQRRDDLRYLVKGYHASSNVGGGEFYWSGSQAKEDHDGGSVIDPGKVFPSNWSDTGQQQIWFTPNATGIGCWVRVYDGLIEPEWYGAVGDGISDDGSALQSAITTGSVLLSNTIYHIGVTIDIPSNRSIKSKGKATILGKMFPEGGEGFGYPLTLFSAVSASDISFSGIVFDFAKREYVYAHADGLTMRNGLYFESVSNLRFDNCEFFDFVTNLKADHEMLELLYFGAVQIKECTDIHLYDIKTSRLREEGFNFYKCRNIKFSGWQADGRNYYGGYDTSSHAAFWYCDGVLVENADIIHVGGSTFNCCAKNVTYSNVKVNYGRDGQGNGFDFGNELGVEKFITSNVLIEKCYLNVNGQALYHVDLEGFTSTLENITVSNCVTRGNTSAIQVGSVNGLKVVDNDIYVSKPTGAEIYNEVSAVQIRPRENPVVENIVVSDNLITARMLLAILPVHDSPLDAGEVYVRNNNVTFHVFDEEATGSGVHYGIRHPFASVSAGTAPINYRKIQIDGNTFKEAMGNAQMSTYGTVDVLQITNNTGKTTSGFKTTQFSSRTCISNGGLVFDENNVYDRFNPSLYRGFDSVTYSNNSVVVQPFSDNANAINWVFFYFLSSGQGKLRVTNNIIKGLIQGGGAVRIEGDPQTMDIIEIRDNWFYSPAGVLVVGHTYTNTPREFP